MEFGQTRVLVAASVTEGVPRWRKGSGLGWVTSEYAMLPRATNTRNDRESVRGRIGGRTHEISRLIGRSLRAIIDYKALGENTIVLDCDVLQADGGTRTASITGAYVALVDAVSWLRDRNLLTAEPLTGSVAAVSVGVVDGVPLHATQLYEASLEGVLLFLILWWYTARPRPRMAPTGLFLIIYSLSRITVEFWRVPDHHLNYLLGTSWVTMGIVLSLPMLLIGLALVFMAYRRRVPSGNFAATPQPA